LNIEGYVIIFIKINFERTLKILMVDMSRIEQVHTNLQQYNLRKPFTFSPT